MQMTTLGKTGLKVSRLGVGLATLGLRMTRDDLDAAGRARRRQRDPLPSWTTTSATSR